MQMDFSLLEVANMVLSCDTTMQVIIPIWPSEIFWYVLFSFIVHVLIEQSELPEINSDSF
jgi:hypothetical protein